MTQGSNPIFYWLGRILRAPFMLFLKLCPPARRWFESWPREDA